MLIQFLLLNTQRYLADLYKRAIHVSRMKKNSVYSLQQTRRTTQATSFSHHHIFLICLAELRFEVDLQMVMRLVFVSFSQILAASHASTISAMMSLPLFSNSRRFVSAYCLYSSELTPKTPQSASLLASGRTAKENQEGLSEYDDKTR